MQVIRRSGFASASYKATPHPFKSSTSTPRQRHPLHIIVSTSYAVVHLFTMSSSTAPVPPSQEKEKTKRDSLTNGSAPPAYQKIEANALPDLGARLTGLNLTAAAAVSVLDPNYSSRPEVDSDESTREHRPHRRRIDASRTSSSWKLSSNSRRT
jgi:hypothetical protein